LEFSQYCKANPLFSDERRRRADKRRRAVSRDVLIVGGGLLGLLGARALAREGLRVLVLERARLGCGASRAGGGILSPLRPWQPPAAIQELARRSLALYPSLAAELRDTGVDPRWRRSGMLLLEAGPAAADERQAAARLAARYGVALETPAPAALRRFRPGLRPARRPALWLPEVCQLAPRRLLRALRRQLARRGVECREGEEAVAWERRGRRILAVRTRRGTRLTAGRFVLAAGAWSGGLLRALGLPALIRPVRGQMVAFRVRGERPAPILLRGEHYLVLRDDGLALAGSTVEEAGFDARGTPAARRDLQAAAWRLLPALKGRPCCAHWGGLRPAGRRRAPYIGPAPGFDNLYLNTGHFRNGILLAPASAELLTGCIARAEAPPPALAVPGAGETEAPAARGGRPGGPGS